MPQNVIVFPSVAASAALFLAGCQTNVPISWTSPPSDTAKGKTIYMRPTSGEGSSIGRHTWSLFAFSGPDIRSVDRSVDLAVTDAVQDAFEAAGYAVRPHTEAPPGTPVVTPAVQSFDYWSYTYFWPITFQGGGVEVGVGVETDGLNVRENKHFRSSSPFWVRFLVAGGFEGAVRDDMTQIVREIKNEVARGALLPPAPAPVPSLPQPSADKPPVTGKDEFIAELSPQLNAPLRPSEGASAQKADSLKARIRQLKSARDAGLLTDAEYRMKVKPVAEELMRHVEEGGAL